MTLNFEPSKRDIAQNADEMAQSYLTKRGGRFLPPAPYHKAQEKVVFAQAFNNAIKDLENAKKKIEKKLKNCGFKVPVEGTNASVNKVSNETFNVSNQKGTQKNNTQGLRLEHEWHTINTALHSLQEKRLENTTVGVLKGLEILALQKRLCSSKKDETAKKEISEKIASKFESADSYQEMLDMRNTVEGSGIGESRLFKLVYNDVDVESCHRIIKAINENAKKAYEENPSQVEFRYVCYTDKDDTVVATLNDKDSKIEGYYPGVMEFNKQFVEMSSKAKSPQPDSVAQDRNKESQGEITFLSARPKFASKLWNFMQKRASPKLKFFGLYGSTSSILQGAKYYVLIKKILLKFAKRFLSGNLLKRVKVYCNLAESKTFISFALDKRMNIDRDLLLRPEARPYFVGDCGEGDLMFLLVKNTGMPSPVTDSRVPPEYRGDSKWEGSLNTPVNPANKPLHFGFAHAFSSPTQFTVRPDPQYREDYEKELNAFVFDNYVDNALYCLKRNVFDKAAADKIVNECKSWLRKQGKMIHEGLAKLKIELADVLKDGDVLDKLPPHLKYRVKLIRSIQAYEAYKP